MAEYLKVQQEASALDKQLANNQAELSLLRAQKLDIQELYQKTHNMLIQVNTEAHRQAEISHRLTQLVHSIIPHLSHQVLDESIISNR